MRKLFIRTENENGTFNCSWYDKNGKRYKEELAWLEHDGLSIRETDDAYGFMGYAKKMRFTIIDDFVGEHPKRIPVKGIITLHHDVSKGWVVN